MTGKGHRATGLGAALIAASIAKVFDMPEIPAALVASVSCTVPDWVEIPIYKGGRRAGSVIPHRTITHWPALWIGLIVWAITSVGGLSGSMMLGVCIGAITHILGDAPNPMGIPWFLPFHRNRIGKKGLWRSGEHEALMVFGYAFIGLLMWRLALGWRPGDVFWLPLDMWLPSFDFGDMSNDKAVRFIGGR